ncbi:hypothetical protein DFH29DRAFT_929738 [Suillus ampliporus]|nr:hypothetical protein DFH29DRAFT_929738 [Suillus ampliporus]
MNYDIGALGFRLGPSAALNDTCASPTNQERAAVSAVKALTDAGMPIHRIVLGVASYGHSFSVPPFGAFVSGTKTLAALPTLNVSNQPLGDIWDDDGGVDVCGVYEGLGGTPAKTVNRVLHPEGRLLISLLYSRMCTIRPHKL